MTAGGALADGGPLRVAVIGGAGFIGSHLVDRLLAEGHAVDVVDDLSTGSLANLGEARRSGGSLKIHHLDVTTDEAASLIGMRRPDVVFQLGLFSRLDRSPRAQARGFEAALATLEAARRFGVSKVVVAVPASSLYGQPAAAALPVKEGDRSPRGVRGVAACAVIDLLATYRERDMIEFTALALTSVYGPRQHPEGGVVGAFVAARDAGRAPVLDGGGRQTRDFVHVDDVVDALVRAGRRGSGLVINVGTGTQTTLRELWRLVAGGAGEPPVDGPARPDDIPRFAVSSARARIHLGWSPWTELADGIAELT